MAAPPPIADPTDYGRAGGVPVRIHRSWLLFAFYTAPEIVCGILAWRDDWRIGTSNFWLPYILMQWPLFVFCNLRQSPPTTKRDLAASLIVSLVVWVILLGIIVPVLGRTRCAA